jgi:hypothetical protein
MPTSISCHKRKAGYPSVLFMLFSSAYSAADRTEVGYCESGRISRGLTGRTDVPGEDDMTINSANTFIFYFLLKTKLEKTTT